MTVFAGDSGNNSITGGPDDDSIFADAGDDTIAGGAGTDYLDGGTGSDTYYFNLGDGEDAIYEYDQGAANGGPNEDTDILVFGAGITTANITVRSDWSSTITISVNGTADSVHLMDFGAGLTHQIEEVHFADGTLWTAADLARAAITATEQDDEIHGTPQADTLSGLGGNDSIYGGDGDDVIEGGDGNDLLYGEYGNNSLSGGAGSDNLYTYSGDDTLAGGTGDDYMSGSYGSDTYYFNLGDGADTIREDDYVGNPTVETDILVLGSGITTGNVTVRANYSGHLTISVDGTDDSVTITNFMNIPSRRIEEVHFADGTIWTAQDLIARAQSGTAEDDTLFGTSEAETLSGLDGDDDIYANGGNDVLNGGGGSDRMIGGRGSDTYLFNLGDGSDTIYEYDSSAYYNGVNEDTDVITFGTGIETADVTVRRTTGGDLVLTIGSSGDRITVTDFFDGLSSQIEEVHFANGDIWNVADLKTLANTPTEGDDFILGSSGSDTIAGLGGEDNIDGGAGDDVLSGGAGDDEIYGSADNDKLDGGDGEDYLFGGAGNDTMTGGIGDDWLNGSTGSDTYIFNLGDGADRISEYDYGGSYHGVNDDTDVIMLGDGITVDNVSVKLDLNGTLVISVVGTNDSIAINNFSGNLGNQVEQVHFADNTVWNAQHLLDLANMPTEGNDLLQGTAGADNMSGLGGNDTLLGEGGNDTLAGGLGDDELQGSTGSDTYVFNLGDGSDTIYEYDAHAASNGTNEDVDVISFGPGITAADLTVRGSRDGSLVISVTGTEDSITIRNFMNYLENQIEELRFSDGSSLTAEALKALARIGTESSDNLIGTSGSDTLSGLGGDDLIYGKDGADVISGGTSWDSLLGEDGDDTLNGDADKDQLLGGAGNDTLTGGTGDDYLSGSTGSDTYYFNLGDGRDSLDEYDYGAARNGVNQDKDVIVFGAGITTDNVSVRGQFGGGIVLSIDGTEDSITISGFRNGLSRQVEEIHFAGGQTWTAADLAALANMPTDGDDYIIGTTGADSLAGLGGNDEISGGSGNDTLSGGLGDDSLNGSRGSDTYVFNLGDGHDDIYEYDYNATYNGSNEDTDVIMLGNGISTSDVRVHRTSGGNLVLSIGGSDSITIRDFFDNLGHQVESVRFADNTTWDAAHLIALANTPTEDDDYLVGTAGKDTISGLGGEDYITAGNGDDVVNGNDGADILFGENDNDVLNGGAGDDMLYGGRGNDTLTGGEGDDYLNGSRGSDTYVFNLGDGKDHIYEYDYNASYYGSNEDTDVITLGNGITTADVQVHRNSSGDLILAIGANDSITINDFFDNLGHQVESVRFADNTIWDAAHLIALANTPTEGNDYLEGTVNSDTISGLGGNDYIAGANGDDVLSGGKGTDNLYGGVGNDTLDGGEGTDRLSGGDGNDTLTGGKGDDKLRGESGSDTYYFNLGDGDDTIGEYDYGAADNGVNDDHDVLVFGNGITMAGMHAKSDGDGILLTFDGTSDSIYLNSFLEGLEYQIEELRFANGDVLTAQQLITLATAPTSGDDDIYGTDGNDSLSGLGGNDRLYGGRGDDTLAGGTGDDYLNGSSGSDTYLFNLGDGADTIREYDYQAYQYGINQYQDVIIFGNGITAANVTVSSNAGGDLILSINGTNDSITIGDFRDGLQYGIEEVRFANGDVWDANYLRSRLNVATELNDLFDGTSGNETFNGLGGEDVIFGNGGNDVLDGGDGNDHLRGGDGNDTLSGGKGSDELNGGSGSDTYMFNLGDGADVIYNYDYGTSTDVLVLGAGITAANLTMRSTYGASAVLSVEGTGDSIRLAGILNGQGGIDEVHFADGSIWTADEIRALAKQATAGDDYLYGTSGNDTIDGLAGNDSIFAGSGNDTLTGGQGDDYLSGGRGSDTYHFNLGDGADIIYDYDGSYGTGVTDVIVFGDGITSSNVLVSRNNYGDLTLSIAGTTDSIVISDFLYGDAYQIEEVRFADGSTWTADDLKSLAVGQTDDDILVGTSAGETLSGLAGNDSLSGLDGNDVLIGGTGSDYLRGGDGSDTYIFNLGDGSDRIYEYNTEDTDILVFGAGISAADVNVRATAGGDVILSINSSGDQIRIEDMLKDAKHPIDEVRFADNTVWDAAELIRRAVAPTNGSDIIWGVTGDETLSGLGGDDSLYSGRDSDTLIGGTGDDYLRGDGGSDTYVFNIGDGVDEIYDYDYYASNYGLNEDQDVIVFGNGITTANVSVRDNGSGGLVLTIGTSGDQIVVDRFFEGLQYQVEEVRFANGEVWDADTLETMALLAGQNNHTPSDVALTASTIAENSAAGTVIGLLSGTDEDLNDTLVYSLSDNANGAFAIVNGQLVVADASLLDFEAGNSLSITVAATDSFGATLYKGFTISLTNVNERPTDIDISNATITENAVAGTVVGTLSAVDPDTGDTIALTLTDDAGGLFAILDGKLVVNSGANLDFESQDAYTVTVRATDAHGLTYDETLAIAVANTNENPSDIALSAASVAESAAAGTIIGTLSGTDPDAGDSLTYTLTNDAGGLFKLVDGKIQLAGSLDFETRSSYTITVQATDTGGLTRSEDFAITVTDVNETPTGMELTPMSIVENAAAGTEVGTLSGLDPDAGDSFTYALTNDAGGMFKLVDGKVLLAGTVDFETRNSYTITVLATDSGGLTVSKDLTISVTDANEAPTDIVLSSASVAENSVAGTVVGTLSGSDPDAGDSLTYSLSNDAGGAFKIVNGAIAVADSAKLDFETTSAYVVTVLATDAHGLTHSEDFTISLTDVNEAPSDISLSNARIAENSKAGKQVGLFSATDPDAGDTLAYTLKNDAGGTFDIVGNKLVVAKGADIDFETRKSYSITVTVSDGTLKYDETFKISVTDVDEAIKGTGKNDNLKGTSAADVILGMNGDDILRGLGGGDELNGGKGIDTASYADAKKGVVANLASPGKNTGDAHGDKYIAIENLTGSKLNDTLTGNGKENVLDGGSGKDRLTGGGDNDTFIFGRKYGTDTITDFTAKGKQHDVIDLSDVAGITNFEDLMKNHLKVVGDDLHIVTTDKSMLVLLDVDKHDLSKADFLF